MVVTLGSSTAIFAANAAALGSKVCFVGMVGRDAFGELVKHHGPKQAILIIPNLHFTLRPIAINIEILYGA